MSRTTRRDRKGKPVREGADIRPSRSCKNNGSCKWCVGTRTHATVRRAPIDETTKLENRK